MKCESSEIVCRCNVCCSCRHGRLSRIRRWESLSWR